MPGTITQKSNHREAETLRQRGGWGLWWRWVLATAGGEFVGFAVPAAVGAVAAWALGRMGATFAEIAMVGVMVLAGVVEGAVLGFAQWLVLRRYIQNMARREWVLATALAAGVAWIIGMLPSTLGEMTTVSPMVLIGGAVLLGAVFVASIGFAQWLVLQRYIQKAGWWVLANAVAWPVGVAMPFIGLSLVPEAAPLAVWVIVGVVSGVLMGAVVGAITGIALVWLLRTPLSRSGERTIQS